MSDIFSVRGRVIDRQHKSIERLQKVVHEKAAEIERLRGERDELRSALDRLQAHAAAGWSLANGAHIEAERLRAALALSQSQNYCTLCGAALDGTSGEHVATSGDRSNK